MDDDRIRREQQEEQLLLEQTRKMRERLKASRVQHKAKRPQISDRKLKQWMESLILITAQIDIGSLTNGLLTNKVSNWNQLLSLNDNEMECLLKDHGGDLNVQCIGMIMDRWRASKEEHQEKERIIRELEEERQRMREEKLKQKEDQKESKKRECDQNVHRFLKEYGLLDLEFVFIKKEMTMNDVAQIDAKWMTQNVNFAKSEHFGDLQIRLKMAVQTLRKQIVREFKAKLRREYRQKEDETESARKRQRLRMYLIRIHPVLGQMEETLSDPIYLLIAGFVVFVVFTFILFVVVGTGTK